MNHEGQVLSIPLEEIIPNRFQPRLSFDEQGLKELADSIKQHGVIQPLVLRRVGDKYEIIAGERRYKASTMAGLTHVPAVVANVDDNKSAEVALVENVQRRDLTAIEEAKSYKNLLDKGYMTQEQLASKMGLSQSAVANKLRLLNLVEEVQDALLNEKISERHARALLVLNTPDEQKKWLERIIAERLTVRQLDTELKKLKLNREDENIPLVNITPNIEEIKNNAVDLNPIIEPKIIPDLLTQSDTVEQIKIEENSEMVQEEVKGDVPQKRFFNFLEYEEANLETDDSEETGGAIMSTIDETSEVPKSISEQMEETTSNPVQTSVTSEVVLSEPTSLEVMETVEKNMPTSVLTFDTLDSVEPKVEANPVKDVAMISDFNIPGNNLIQDSADSLNKPVEQDSQIEVIETATPEIIEKAPVSERTFIDPVASIEKLDPQYLESLKAEAGLDLKNAINKVRDLNKELNALGFVVELEEIDFENQYQFVVKIQK